jgi:hypothetical protein
MNPVFKTLTLPVLAEIETLLAKSSSVDEDLWDLLVDELGLTAEQADAAVTLRPNYTMGIPTNGRCLLLQKLTLTGDALKAKPASQKHLNFDQLLDAYRTLLQDRPGQLLKLGTHWAAGLNTQGRLYCTAVDPNSARTMFEVFDFDREAFVKDHWQCETPEQTQSAVVNPEFI